jgi:hypothetical protein
VRRSPNTPLFALDRAVELCRAAKWTRVVLCALPLWVMTWLTLLVYYLEWVEGVRALRPAFALAFALSYLARTLVLARFAGGLVDQLLVPVGGAARHAPARVPLSMAVLMGGELWLWLWLPVLLLRIDVLLVPLCLPLLALRGALLPSWLAASDGSPEANTRAALSEALRAAHGRRTTNAICELFLLVGGFVLALNLGALTAALISISQDVLGLELSFVRAFVSPRNHFALILLAGLSLSALEPVRAALSAVHYAEYRMAAEAVELRSMIERVVARARPALIFAMMCGGLSLSMGVEAQSSASDWSQHNSSATEECDEGCREARARDDALLVDLVSILERPEFRDFPDRRWAAGDAGEVSLATWLDRFVAWLFPTREAAEQEAARPRASAFRSAPTLSAGLLALSALVLLSLLLRGPRPVKRRRVQSALSPAEPFADAKAESARPAPRDAREELYALYSASLRGLSARGLLTLSRHSTNGAYLRALASPRERAWLDELTGLFEQTRYGAGLPSQAELKRARELASQLCEAGSP